MDSIAELLKIPGTSVAIVGATDNRAKYGNIIYRDMKSKGYPVFAVNPTRTTVEGDPCWPNLGALPEVPTIVNIVVPPQRTLRVLETCIELGIRNVWIQPGAADDAVREFVRKHDFSALIDACIMVMADHSPRSLDD